MFFIGGMFRGGVAQWDGEQIIGTGAPLLRPPCVFALALVDPVAQSTWDIYVGGCFSRAGDEEVKAVARYVWDLQAKEEPKWEALGDGIAGVIGGGNDPQVFAISTSDELGFFGGDFANAGRGVANNIASWNHATEEWSSLGGGVYGVVRALQAAPRDGGVYVGGKFCARDAPDVCNLAWWDEVQGWKSFGGGVKGEVLSLLMSSHRLWVGGRFAIPEAAQFNLAMWDGAAWDERDFEWRQGVVETLSACPCDWGTVYEESTGVCTATDELPGAHPSGDLGALLVLCVAVGLAVGLVGFGLWFIIRRRRRYSSRGATSNTDGTGQPLVAYKTYTTLSQRRAEEEDFFDYEDDL